MKLHEYIVQDITGILKAIVKFRKIIVFVDMPGRKRMPENIEAVVENGRGNPSISTCHCFKELNISNIWLR